MDTATTELQVGLIAHVKAVLVSQAFLERHRCAEKHFTRQTCLNFVVVVVFLLNLLKHALQDELDEFFKVLKGEESAVRVVTKSAFTHARKKLKYDAFIELNQVQNDYFYTHGPVQIWHGKRLLAVDGSMTELPQDKAICEHFGVWHPASGGICPKARISQLFDVLNHITIDALIAPKSEGERKLAAQHFCHLKAADLVLLDRGYPAFWLFALISSLGANFCVRLKVSDWKVAQALIASGQDEQIISLAPSYDAKKECLARQLPSFPLTLRLLRIPLDTGECEVLLTSLLDSQAFPADLFQELYHCRWPVEEDYKVIKSRIEVENWSGKSVHAIYQDFHAKIFTKNLTALLTHPAQAVVKHQNAQRKHVYQVNMANALSKVKDSVVLLFQRITLIPILQSLWQLFTHTIEPIRPGRAFPRSKRLRRRRFPFSYKSLR